MALSGTKYSENWANNFHKRHNIYYKVQSVKEEEKWRTLHQIIVFKKVIIWRHQYQIKVQNDSSRHWWHRVTVSVCVSFLFWNFSNFECLTKSVYWRRDLYCVLPPQNTGTKSQLFMYPFLNTLDIRVCSLVKSIINTDHL